jgi:hypothetical protein
VQAKKKPCDGEDCNGALQFIWKNVGGKKYCRSCSQKLPKDESHSKAKPTRQYTTIPPRSHKRIRDEAAYKALREAFLTTHPQCMIAIKGICSGHPANQVHHSYSGKDRDKYFLDTTTWFASEDKCHDWVHNNPTEAREVGFLK